MTRRNQARSKPPPRRAYIASWDRAKREKNIKPRRKGGYRDTLGSRVVARLSTESKESTRFFFPSLYSFESPLISRGLRRRIFAGERRSQLKLSRIATFVSLPSLCLKIGEFQSRGRAWKRIYPSCEKFRSLCVPICKNFVTSCPPRVLYKASTHHLRFIHRGWKLLEFRIHRLTQLRRLCVSITVLLSLLSSAPCFLECGGGRGWEGRWRGFKRAVRIALLKGVKRRRGVSNKYLFDERGSSRNTRVFSSATLFAHPTRFTSAHDSLTPRLTPSACYGSSRRDRERSGWDGWDGWIERRVF